MRWETFLNKNREKFKILGIDLAGINTVRFHPSETFMHRLVKFLIAHHLFEQHHFFKTEQSIKRSVCDVIHQGLRNLRNQIQLSIGTKSLEDEKRGNKITIQG